MVHSGTSRVLRVHSGSRGFTRAGLGVVEFAWVHFGAPRGLRVNSVVCGFTFGVTGFFRHHA